MYGHHMNRRKYDPMNCTAPGFVIGHLCVSVLVLFWKKDLRPRLPIAPKGVCLRKVFASGGVDRQAVPAVPDFLDNITHIGRFANHNVSDASTNSHAMARLCAC